MSRRELGLASRLKEGIGRGADQRVGGLASQLLAKEVHDELERGLGLQLELVHLRTCDTSDKRERRAQVQQFAFIQSERARLNEVVWGEVAPSTRRRHQLL